MKAKPKKSRWGPEWVRPGCGDEVRSMGQLVRKGRQVRVMHLSCYKRQQREGPPPPLVT